MPKCKCGKTITFYAKQCQRCYLKWLKNNIKNFNFPNRKGKNNMNYKQGEYSDKIPKCLKCGKQLSIYKLKTNLCISCYGKTRKGKPSGKITITGKTIIEHHIDLNKSNNKKKNKLMINQSNHAKLHQWAYKYLVKTGQIKKYIKWFLKSISISANGLAVGGNF